MRSSPGADLSAGFVHDGRIIYAIEYWLETPPPGSSHVIVWLTPDGDCQNPRIQSAYTGRRLVTTKAGEHVRVGDKLEKVAGVNVYRASQLPGLPGQG